jgi:hypothetical protein
VTFSPEEAAAAIEGLIDPIPYDPDFGWGRPEPVWFERPQPGAALAWEAIWLGLDALESNPNAPQAQISGPDIPGGSITSATLTLGGSANGTIGTVGDTDWYRVELAAGVSYNFTLNGLGPTALSDPYLELYSSAGALVSLDDDTGPGLNSLLRFTPAQSGTYYINARAFDTETGNYTIAFNTGPAQNPLDTINLGFTLVSSNVTYYFAQTGDTYAAGGTQTASRSWTAAEQDAARTAFATYAAVSGLTFTEVSSQSAARFVMMITELDGNVLGRFFSGANGGLGQFDPAGSGWTTNGLQPGGLGFVTLIHEIGHGLGLAHPHDAGGGSEVMQGVVDEFNSLGTFLLNQGVFTTMTYNDGWQSAPHGPTPSSSFGVQSTPMALDIASIQQRYGVNTNTNTGNNDYVLPTSSGVGVGYRAIWDADGTDTISHNGSASATIDLRPATLQTAFGGGGYVSFVNGIHGGFTIAANVVIENAIGGSGADTIIGNAAANRLQGNGGVDSLTGGGGLDVAVYSGSSASASFTRVSSGDWTVNAGSDGFDTLTEVEFLEFANRTLALRPAEGSIDGNGTSDIVLRSTNGTVALWTQTGATTTSTQIVAASDPNFAALGQGDFNGDGRFDLLFRNAGGILAQWQMNGAAVSAVGAYVTDPNWTVAGIGDFNGDFRDDILWRSSSGLLAQWQMDGLAASAVGVFAASDPTWAISQVADFNGDGRDDILWRNSSGLLALWQMDSFAVTSAGVIAASDPTWVIVGTGDFNGDLREDILWRSSNGVLAQWTMDGGSVISVGTFALSDTDWQVSDIGDYDGDGRDDILWQGPDGTFALWTLNGFAVTSTGLIGSPGAGWTDFG